MVDTVQPQRFAGFRNPSASSLLMKMNLLRWNNAKPTPEPDTRPASSRVTGAGCRGENPPLRRREKNVLDNPFYRSGVITTMRYLFAPRAGSTTDTGGFQQLGSGVPVNPFAKSELLY